jgi:hypothetical protein
MTQGLVGSSPLRGSEGDESEGTGNWVERTGNVHLASSEGGLGDDGMSVDEAAEEERSPLKDLYAGVLGELLFNDSALADGIQTRCHHLSFLGGRITCYPQLSFPLWQQPERRQQTLSSSTCQS